MLLIKKISILFLCFFLTVALFLYLKIFGFGSLVNLINRSKAKKIVDIRYIFMFSKAVNFIGSHLKFFSCFVKASTLRILFNADDLLIKIGIKYSDHKFKSHAWIEYRGEIILNKLDDINLYKIIHTI